MRDQEEWLAEQFEVHREHLRAVAYRILGSLNDADDAVQVSWLKLSASDTHAVENLGGWMTTIVARTCLDMLRSRKSRPEAPPDSPAPEAAARDEERNNPEYEAQLADGIGIALLVVLDTLAPAERLTFVLHDVFGIPFDDIAPIVGRSSATTRQLASRARRRIRGAAAVPTVELNRQREVVNAFLAAARTGDFDRLLTLLDPDVVLRSDSVRLPSGNTLEVRGAQRVAKMYTRPDGARGIRPALVNGQIGLIVAPRGRLVMVIYLTFHDGKIAAIDATADPLKLRQTQLAVLDE